MRLPEEPCEGPLEVDTYTSIYGFWPSERFVAKVHTVQASANDIGINALVKGLRIAASDKWVPSLRKYHVAYAAWQRKIAIRRAERPPTRSQKR
jgi:hypothetical protein